MHYFDYAASAPRRDEVTEAMERWMHGTVGNPSGQHRAAREAKRALEDAREEIASLMQVPPQGVIFTAGGTEANHIALAGALARFRRLNGPEANIVVTSVEHSSVLKTAHHLASLFEGVTVREVNVHDNGFPDPMDLGAKVDQRTAIVSIMAVNNETGVAMPMEGAIGDARKRGAPETVYHSDCVAAAPWIYLPAITSGLDAFSICAHKIGGPVNSGALLLSEPDCLDPVIVGGGQEKSLRGGTVDVAAAVGLATALRLVQREREEVCTRVRDYAIRLYAALSFLPGCAITAAGHDKVEGIVHVTFDKLASEEILFLLDQAGICASAGSSCASGAAEPSHVMRAMQISPTRVTGALRLSMGPGTTAEDVDAVIDALATIIYSLQEK